MTGVIASGIIFLSGMLLSGAVSAQFANEESDENGVLNPVDYSWRYYKEQLKRFPERAGLVCYNAYLLDKSSIDPQGAIEFLTQCAEVGNVASMIYLSALYDSDAGGIPKDLPRSTMWLERAAKIEDDAGYGSLARYHYGVALFEGRGVPVNQAQGRRYLELAAEEGIEDAIVYLDGL